MYDIEITYKTGNSFNTYKTTDILDLPVASLEIAKENLQRIKIHHKIINALDSYNIKAFNEIEYPNFMILTDEVGYPMRGIKLKIDENCEHNLLYPFWVGYFEKLISAKIIAINDELEFFIN
jgi:uncharacterized HAD superfamily protein